MKDDMRLFDTMNGHFTHIFPLVKENISNVI